MKSGDAFAVETVVVERALTEEEEIKEATRLANYFVAGVMASGVADYIKALHDDSDALVNKIKVTPAQVRVTGVKGQLKGGQGTFRVG